MPVAPPAIEKPQPKASVPAAPAQPAARFGKAGAWQITAIVAGVFVAVVLAGMLIGYERMIAEDPLDARELTTLREKLHEAPKDETLKRQIRAIDLREREQYFSMVQRNVWGGWMLLAGGTVFVIAFSKVRAQRRRAPMPLTRYPSPSESKRETDKAVAAVATGGVVLGLAMLAVILVQRGKTPTPIEKASSDTTSAHTPELARKQWPRFRGADGSGVSDSTSLPITWNVETGENIAWKARLPLGGFSSPVVWGDRVFLTGSEKSARELFCFNAGTGALLWRLPVKLVPDDLVGKMEIPEQTGLAASTPATDDKRVFAIFATGELVAADFSGRLVWSKNFGKPHNQYGHATSLLVWRDKLIVQFDQGEEDAGKSRLYAFDAATGNIVWQQPRKLPSSWSTPIVIEAGGREQIITLGTPWAISYSPADGQELWRFGELGGDLAPSPIFAAGLLFVANPNHEMRAVRPDGQGDVSKTHVAWSGGDNIPDTTSPVSNGELLFTLETYGMLTCYEAAAGKKMWEHSFETEFHASPSIVGERLVLITTEGAGIVAHAGREFKELNRTTFGEGVHATPAFVEDRMFVRGVTNLFCIASPSSGKAASPQAETKP